jgi:D-arginine dehydrogenase
MVGMNAAEVVVLGGGVAGLATALPLARAGVATLLVEREPLLASHSTARNAAIWLPTYGGGTTPPLARRTAELLGELCDEPWLDRTGALLVSPDPALLDATVALSRAEDVPCERVDAAGAHALAPALQGGNTQAGVHLPDAGVLDIHAIVQALIRATRDAGARLRTGLEAARVVTEGARVVGVAFADGSQVTADAVVIASGAWAASHGAGCGAALPLEALRRHLVHLSPQRPAPGPGPVVWSVDPEAYFRPEAGGVLASPCDETPSAPCLPDPCDDALATLVERLSAVAPALAESDVLTRWACLRTFAPDRELVAGPDPRVEGLHWLAGLGGRGMTVGLGAGELTAARIQGRAHALAEAVDPKRLLAEGP